MAAILTLLTDFGESDGYVGALRGAIIRVAPRLQLETLTHGVQPHDIGAGAYWLAASAPAYPLGTVHCAVVDPGVGTSRPLVAARVDGQTVVAPDNGLLHFLWLRGKDRLAVRVEQTGVDPSGLSNTFHGRDLIGPLAARLATGAMQLEALGPRLRTPQLIPGYLPEGDSAGTSTKVVLVDRFGNVILSVARTPWYSPEPASAALKGGRKVAKLVRTYGEITDEVALLWNSANHLELAANGRSAAELLQLGPGDTVRVAWAKSASAGRRRSSEAVAAS